MKYHYQYQAYWIWGYGIGRSISPYWPVLMLELAHEVKSEILWLDRTTQPFGRKVRLTLQDCLCEREVISRFAACIASALRPIGLRRYYGMLQISCEVWYWSGLCNTRGRFFSACPDPEARDWDESMSSINWPGCIACPLLFSHCWMLINRNKVNIKDALMWDTSSGKVKLACCILTPGNVEPLLVVSVPPTALCVLELW